MAVAAATQKLTLPGGAAAAPLGSAAALQTAPAKALAAAAAGLRVAIKAAAAATAVQGDTVLMQAAAVQLLATHAAAAGRALMAEGRCRRCGRCCALMSVCCPGMGWLLRRTHTTTGWCCNADGDRHRAKSVLPNCMPGCWRGTQYHKPGALHVTLPSRLPCCQCCLRQLPTLVTP